jgi:hypothetical protein
VWSEAELEADRRQSVDLFRDQRLKEPLEAYGEAFDEAQGTMEDLLETTLDLSQLDDEALGLLADRALQEAVRYVAAPPISVDDLKTLVESTSISPKALRGDPDLVARLVETIRAVLDRRRFPWVMEGREPTEAERHAAIVASTALIATQRVATGRRNESKTIQEELVRQTLLDQGFVEVVIARRRISMLNDGPGAGTFCKEVTLGNSRRKADLVIGLWDGRTMPLECKVSNSSINSLKRLNNDTAAKAETWRRDLGTTYIVPTVVLSGVYDLPHLLSAQADGLTLYWAHRLSDLAQWIEQTRAS